ncbi:hypothetical protein ACKZDW_13215 [Ralstonia syzygii subsp. celebesensis]|uniref:hypothetical protein n=1 Tax=Ralstonia syzygii TaxID=28097 RepID=UPI00387E0445
MKESTGIGRLPRWQQIALFVVLLVSAMGALEWAKSTYRSHQAPKSEAEAAERLVGTWTYTEPIDVSNDPFPFQWVKWEVRPDGTITSWNAKPTDNNWGEGVTAKYQIVSGKFASNGERWFGIADPANSYTVGVLEAGSIVLHMLPAANRKAGAMVKGDKNPFSK